MAGLALAAVWINLLMKRDTRLPTPAGMKMSGPVVLCVGLALLLARAGMRLSQPLRILQYCVGSAIYWACVLTTIGLTGLIKPFEQIRAIYRRTRSSAFDRVSG